MKGNRLSRFFGVLLSVTLLFTMVIPATGMAEEWWELVPGLDYLILVNDDHAYEFGGEYDEILKQNLVHTPDAYGADTLVESATYRAFQLLQADLLEEGMVVRLLSGYRTEADQEWLVNYYKENPVPWKVCAPGTSDHHTGLALSVMIWYHEMDENGEDSWLFFTETEERRKTIEYFKLLHDTMADYGFIDRYPPDKEEWTGAPDEPFEIRFVGSSEIAHEIMDNNLCLEEYLSRE